MIPNLKKKYIEQSKDILKEKYNYKNVMMLPKVEKVVLNMGVGTAIQDKKKLELALKELTAIAGQKAVKTKAKRSIASFKLREGMEIGCKVTLRGNRMYEFLERLVYISLPSVKDFKGIKSNGFDGRGNYSLGIIEHLIFPEIEYDKIEEIKGLNISVVTTAKTDEEAKSLLETLDFPFAKR
jgi:large subunit ribosomal protein L5